MVKQNGEVTLTPLEHAVFAKLVDHGPCETGHGTIDFERRSSSAVGPPRVVVHQVDHTVAKRLAKSGLVDLVHGVAAITDAGRQAMRAGMPPA